MAVCRLEVRLDGRQRVHSRLHKLPRVGRLRVGRARHLARLLGRLKVAKAVLVVAYPGGQAAERVANRTRRGVDVEPRIARLVQNLAVRELAQPPRVVEDVGVALAQNLGEAVRLGRVRLPVELQKPVGRRRRDGDPVAKALVEAPALLHQGVDVPEPAVNVLGAVLGRRFGGRLALGLGKAAEGVGDAAAALHHRAHHRALLRDHRGQGVDKRVLLRLAPGRFSAAELLQVARVHGRLVHVGLEIALEGVDARVGLGRRARPPPSRDRLLLHPPALPRRLLLALPPILRLLAHRLLDAHRAQHHLCQVQARLAQVLVDHVARHIVLLQRVVDQTLGHALGRQERQRAVAAGRVRVVVFAQPVGGQQLREPQLRLVVSLLVELPQHPRRLRLCGLLLGLHAIVAAAVDLASGNALPAAGLVEVFQNGLPVRGLDVRARRRPLLLPPPGALCLPRVEHREEALAADRRLVLAVEAVQALRLAEVGPERCGVLRKQVVVLLVGRGADGRGQVVEHERGEVGRGRRRRRRRRRLGLKGEKLGLLLELLLVEAATGCACALVGAQAANFEDFAVVVLVKASQKEEAALGVVERKGAAALGEPQHDATVGTDIVDVELRGARAPARALAGDPDLEVGERRIKVRGRRRGRQRRLRRGPRRRRRRRGRRRRSGRRRRRGVWAFNETTGDEVAEAGVGQRHCVVKGAIANCIDIVAGLVGVAVRWMVLVLKVAVGGVSCTSRGFDGTPRARFCRGVALADKLVKVGIVGLERRPSHVPCAGAPISVARRRVEVACATGRRRVGHNDRLCIAARRRRAAAGHVRAVGGNFAAPTISIVNFASLSVGVCVARRSRHGCRSDRGVGVFVDVKIAAMVVGRVVVVVAVDLVSHAIGIGGAPLLARVEASVPIITCNLARDTLVQARIGICGDAIALANLNKALQQLLGEPPTVVSRRGNVPALVGRSAGALVAHVVGVDGGMDGHVLFFELATAGIDRLAVGRGREGAVGVSAR